MLPRGQELSASYIILVPRTLSILPWFQELSLYLLPWFLVFSLLYLGSQNSIKKRSFILSSDNWYLATQLVEGFCYLIVLMGVNEFKICATRRSKCVKWLSLFVALSSRYLVPNHAESDSHDSSPSKIKTSMRSVMSIWGSSEKRAFLDIVMVS